MTYTDEELRKATVAAMESATLAHWDDATWREQEEANRVARAVLDAVLPDHDRQLRADTLAEVVDEWLRGPSHFAYWLHRATNGAPSTPPQVTP